MDRGRTLFTVYHSNQTDILKTLVANIMHAAPLHNPFEKEHILVQSPGMSQWLKIELAKELGIAANIDFPLPATFIWNMFIQILDDVPKKSAFNKESLTWKLMHILPSQLEQEAFSPLKRYLHQDEDGSKLYQLAEKIADIFDGYLVYRPEWMAAWEQGQDVVELEGEQPWQKQLWQALYQHTLDLGQSPYHRANLYEDFIQRLEQADSKQLTNLLPSRLFVFGISSLPPRFIDALAALGQHIDVHLMFTNPCQYYWGEIRDNKFLSRLALKHDKETEQTEHSLLASMGKLGRDNIYLLSQLSANDIPAFVELERDTLLHNIQADILYLQERQDDRHPLSSEHKLVLTEKDDSLTLHACHSPMREVEVLHDRLLALFEQKPELNPRDIIIMVPDINAYSPAIQAVFGNAAGQRFIPYSISDRSASQESPLLNAFMRILSLPRSRCHASELLELLETPEVLARFELSVAEFELAKRWVEETGVRWGLDQTTGHEFQLPETKQNTWLFGIQRMLLGYAMHGSIDVYSSQNNDIAPYNEVQGMEAELAGKLSQFVESIIIYRTRLNQLLSASEWRDLLLELIESFFEVNIEGEVALKTLRDTLGQFSEQVAESGYEHSISLQVLTDYLSGKLSGAKTSQRFLAGQVNFCTLTPMRSIPFEVVCLLGMNDGVYPRIMPAEGLDLLNGRGRVGDRSRRDDDRYLFLEALLSAQNKLYISYVARSIQDNSERAPSILVSELLEYCGQNYCMKEDREKSSDDSSSLLIDSITTHYPMTPFSEAAYDGEYQSYAKEWLPAVNRYGKVAEQFIQPLKTYQSIAEDPELLSLNELQQFWRLPVQYFFNRRLKVFFDEQGQVTQDEEPFILDNLQSYQLRDRLLDNLLTAKIEQQDAQACYEAFIRAQRAKGLLPQGAFGEIELSVNREVTEQLVECLYELCRQKQQDKEITLTILLAGWDLPIQITGWITGCYQSGLVRYRSGKIRSQDWLAAWIDHLCLAASGDCRPTHIVGVDKKSGAEHQVILPLSVDEAQTHLATLVGDYFLGLEQPLAYFPKTVLSGMERVMAGKEDADAKMANSFNDGYYFSGEGRQRYIQRVWPQWNDILASTVLENGRKIMLPLLQQSIAYKDWNKEQ